MGKSAGHLHGKERGLLVSTRASDAGRLSDYARLLTAKELSPETAMASDIGARLLSRLQAANWRESLQLAFVVGRSKFCGYMKRASTRNGRLVDDPSISRRKITPGLCYCTCGLRSSSIPKCRKRTRDLHCRQACWCSPIRSGLISGLA
jgi:hypothetical protein